MHVNSLSVHLCFPLHIFPSLISFTLFLSFFFVCNIYLYTFSLYHSNICNALFHDAYTSLSLYLSLKHTHISTQKSLESFLRLNASLARASFTCTARSARVIFWSRLCALPIEILLSMICNLYVLCLGVSSITSDGCSGRWSRCDEH